MTLATLVGVTVFGFGPSAALFFSVIAKRSQLVLIAVTSAFFCLIALVLTGALYLAVDGLENSPELTIIIGVMFQEVARWGFLELYDRGDRRVHKLVEGSSKSPFTDFSSAISAGFGFGLVYALIMYGGVLGASTEPGDYFTEACPKVSGFIVSAMLALLYQVLHIALSILMLDAVRRQQSERYGFFFRLISIMLMHLAVSLLSLLNTDADMGGCKSGITLMTVAVVLICAAGVLTVRKKDYGSLVYN